MAKVTDPASVGDTLLLGPKKELPVKFKPLPHFPSKPDKEPPAKFKPLLIFPRNLIRNLQPNSNHFLVFLRNLILPP